MLSYKTLLLYIIIIKASEKNLDSIESQMWEDRTSNDCLIPPFRVIGEPVIHSTLNWYPMIQKWGMNDKRGKSSHTLLSCLGHTSSPSHWTLGCFHFSPSTHFFPPPFQLRLDLLSVLARFSSKVGHVMDMEVPSHIRKGQRLFCEGDWAKAALFSRMRCGN